MFLTCRYRRKLTILGSEGPILGDFGPFWQKGEKQQGRSLGESEKSEKRAKKRQKTAKSKKRTRVIGHLIDQLWSDL